MRARIEEMLPLAVTAPSGDNSQPWIFSFPTDDILRITNVPGKDNPILNFKQTGSLVSHGAIIRNLRLLAGERGLLADVRYLPGPENCTAEICFSDASARPHPLVRFIPERYSNRTHYKKAPLSEEDAVSIAEAGAEVPNTVFQFSKPNTDKKRVAHALSTMENIALQVPELHALFFKDILWKREQNDSGTPGLYIKTLELPPPAQLAMRVLKKWEITNALNQAIGLSKKIAAEMASVYRDSAQYGAIFIPDRSSQSYISTGEAMQSVWLAATARSISVQPVTGLMFLAHRAEAGDMHPIPESFIPEILAAYRTVNDAFETPAGYHLAFLMRLGHSKRPTARSRRLPPVIVS